MGVASVAIGTSELASAIWIQGDGIRHPAGVARIENRLGGQGKVLNILFLSQRFWTGRDIVKKKGLLHIFTFLSPL